MINYYNLQNIKYKNKLFIIVFSIILGIILIFSCIAKCYSSYVTYAKESGKLLEISLPLENSDVVKGNKIKINNDIYDYKVIEISPLYEQNYVNYQNYKIKVNKSFKENEVLNVTFYFKKQRIIQKIFEVIL